MATMKNAIEDLGQAGGEDFMIHEEGHDQPVQEPKSVHRKKNKAMAAKGIGPKSPTVYLLPEEKEFISMLQAYIRYTTGKRYHDHELIMEALYEWAKKKYKDFNIK